MDIGKILRDWSYEPNRVSARKVSGDDGRQKIQLRLDLGLLQMEIDGRPDGQRPHGCESLLAYQEKRLREFRMEYGTDEGFCLDEAACEKLRNEAVMYYHRYLAAFVLEEFDAVVRDTKRNLRAMDLCAAYAEDEADRVVMEQYRPYIIMMFTRARALAAYQQHRPRAALAAIRKGVCRLEEFYCSMGDDETVGRGGGEIAILRAMEKELEERVPRDPLRALHEDLAVAIREERYEDAAGLRDRLRRMSGEEKLPPPA